MESCPPPTIIPDPSFIRDNRIRKNSYKKEISLCFYKYILNYILIYVFIFSAKQVGQIESDLKVKSQAYNALKTSLQSMEKKQTGSLMTRNLGDLVKKEHFVLESEYLTTMLVVVPLSMINDWHAKYEQLTDMIVPRSTSMIFQDSDHALMTVSLFHKVVDEFKHKVYIFRISEICSVFSTDSNSFFL